MQIVKISKAQNILYKILYTVKKNQVENKQIQINIQDRYKFSDLN